MPVRAVVSYRGGCESRCGEGRHTTLTLHEYSWQLGRTRKSFGELGSPVV